MNCIIAWSNNPTDISFLPTFNQEKLQLNHYYKHNENDSIQITNLKFYISNIAIYRHHKLIFKESNSYHLIDYTNNTNPTIFIANTFIKKNSSISFDIGIDSITNVSGAMGGDLDPTKGMYWSWQSGYINFKLEGNTNLCPLNNHFFEYHIGGYIAPNSSIQHVDLSGHLNTHNTIEMKLDELCNHINFASQNNIMSPSVSAVDMSKLIKHSFSLK
ncbi:MAG: MbnP family protein [Bacteroidota bacterium]